MLKKKSVLDRESGKDLMLKSLGSTRTLHYLILQGVCHGSQASIKNPWVDRAMSFHSLCSLSDFSPQ